MKTLEELAALKERVKKERHIDEDSGNYIRVLVGLATCGIAAGANPVMAAFKDEVSKKNLSNVSVVQTGCIGICQYEPVVEVVEPGKEKVTYVKMTAEKAIKVVDEHLAKGNVVDEYTIGSVAK